MTDGGDGGHGCTLNRSFLNNVVLKSSYTAVGMSSLRLGHVNPGSAAAQIDDLAELFKKRWHTNKRIGIPGYKVARSDRRDGRRSRGFAVYIRDDLKYKILCKSPDSCMIDYIFIEL
jgi:hypothetical protein